MGKKHTNHNVRKTADKMLEADSVLKYSLTTQAPGDLKS